MGAFIHGLGSICHTQLVDDRADVCFGSFWTDEHQLCNALVAYSLASSF